MILLKRLKNLRALYKRKHLDYRRQKTLVNIIKMWTKFEGISSTSNANKQRLVLIECFKILLKNKKEIPFKRIAKTLDWTNPTVSLVVELRLANLIDKKTFNQAMADAECIHIVYEQDGTIDSFKELYDPLRSSSVKDISVLLSKDPKTEKLHLCHLTAYRKMKAMSERPNPYSLDKILKNNL